MVEDGFPSSKIYTHKEKHGHILSPTHHPPHFILPSVPSLLVEEMLSFLRLLKSKNSHCAKLLYSALDLQRQMLIIKSFSDRALDDSK